MSSSREETNIAAVRTFYGRVLGGDAEGALREGLASEFVWENPLPPPIPFAGDFRGPEGAARYLALIFTHLDLEQFEIDDVMARGARVVVLGHETARVKTTDQRYTQHWVHVVELCDGRIVRIREYNDSAAVLTAFGLRVSDKDSRSS